MRINDRDDVNHNEAARVTLLSLRIARREARGLDTSHLEDRQDRILDRAARREAERDEIRAAAQRAKRQAEFEAKKKRAVDRATRNSRSK